ncbi:hypothetical protein PLICRDRAFT_124700 [Plicaturopsis crispa FD-325 SS-3]|nr:hypothetical protein PLICRDRAFT_124700 [Plicaturopsis crispa FD-325 SS-3]
MELPVENPHSVVAPEPESGGSESNRARLESDTRTVRSTTSTATTLVDDEDEDHSTYVDPEGEEEFSWIKGALLGTGSFGNVHLAMDGENGLLMAVKQVEFPADPGEDAGQILDALRSEVESLGNLQHENIVMYLKSTLEGDCLNIFSEYIPGGSITSLLRDYGSFEEPLVRNFVRQMLEGLKYLHDRDIIHRHIKGANVLVNSSGCVKLSDFGISKDLEDDMLRAKDAEPSAFQRSAYWTAPEVARDGVHTKQADIWSVGCFAIEMITGDHPWPELTGPDALSRIGEMTAPPTIPSSIGEEAKSFLSRALDINSEARPPAEELLQHPWLSRAIAPSDSNVNEPQPTAAS